MDPAGIQPPIGRAEDMERLQRLLPGRGRTDAVGLVVGDPGIGKSTLMRALAAGAERSGIRVGWGAAGSSEGASPLWPWFEAVRDLDPDQQIISAGDEPRDGDLHDIGLTRALTAWLAETAKAGPAILMIEDLHLADPTAIDLFAYLTRRPLPDEVSIVATARPGRAEIDGLTCRRLRLAGLDAAAVGVMAAASRRDVDGEDLRALTRRTGGNPLFVQRLLDEGLVGDGQGQLMPEDIAALLRRQLAGAPAEARPILDALSVLGRADLAVLADVAGVADVRAVVARTPRALVQIDGATAYFPHGLIREFLYDDLASETRFALHANAADALRHQAGPITIAHHLARAAASHRTLAAAEAAAEAARIARSMGALAEAIDHRRLHVAILREVGSAGATADASIDLAIALAELGRISEAETLLWDVGDLDGVSPIDAATRRRVVREYGRLRWREEPNASRLEPGRLRRTAVAWLADSDDARDQAVLHTALVQVGEITGITEAHLVDADRAVAAAAGVDDATVVAEAHLARRRALMVHPARLEDRRAASEAGLRHASATRDPELVARARRLALADAMASADRERALMLLPPDPVSVADREHQALTMATIAAAEGRYDDVDAILDDASKELSYLGHQPPSLDFVRIVHSWDLGRLDAALAEFEPLLPAIADPALRAAVSLSYATAGNHIVAGRLIDEAFESLAVGTPSPLWTVAMALIGESAAAIDHRLVPALHDELSEFAGVCAVPGMVPVPWIGSIDRILGLLALRLGRGDQAIEHLERSLAIHQRMHAQPWVARSHAALAAAHDATGDPTRAAHHRTEAEGIAARLGMSPTVLVVGTFPATPRPAPMSPAATAGGPGGRGRRARLRLEGDVWRVGLGDEEALIAPSTGMDYLAMLVARPDTDWHAVDLYQSVTNGPRLVEGSAGPVLDDPARRAYQQRHRDLVAELDRATADADLGSIEALQNEIQQLEDELVRAYGLGGRPRSIDDPTERARVNVRRAISRAFDRLDEHAPALAAHLRRSIETGRFCRYSPDPTAPVVWD